VVKKHVARVVSTPAFSTPVWSSAAAGSLAMATGAVPTVGDLPAFLAKGAPFAGVFASRLGGRPSPGGPAELDGPAEVDEEA
jgi:hypothetical protein